MTYIDGFILPILREHLVTYQNAAQKIAAIWKEYGALEYAEFVSDGASTEGIRPFTDAVKSSEDDVVIFGWVKFASRADRDLANEKVPLDPRMQGLMAPISDPEKPIFELKKMVYGGFEQLVF